MDPTQARRLRIDRRASGMRRQRRVTQAATAGAVAAAVAFGWVFAHPATAGTDTSDSTTSSTGGGGAGQESSTGDGTAPLQQSDQAPGPATPGPAAGNKAPGRVQPDVQSGGS
jgi:hypothetical protein